MDYILHCLQQKQESNTQAVESSKKIIHHMTLTPINRFYQVKDYATKRMKFNQGNYLVLNDKVKFTNLSKWTHVRLFYLKKQQITQKIRYQKVVLFQSDRIGFYRFFYIKISQNNFFMELKKIASQFIKNLMPICMFTLQFLWSIFQLFSDFVAIKEQAVKRYTQQMLTLWKVPEAAR
ncbi:unnamed protein product [Paramecium octaurelia]|uniref:Uncharacterized protein n=1 Tax=Paramecium octaurelia TaxID=43137 RepID=A0A8S1UZZ8_PAROT|nr:unnamed protein product [Paramecium octaurelia]